MPTNINCSANCMYQQDGKCCLENVAKQSKITPNQDCIYFCHFDVNTSSSPTIRNIF